MKFLATIEDISTTFKNEMFITYKISNRNVVNELKQDIDKFKGLNSMTMRNIEDNRSLKQNALLWKVIAEINFKMNGSRKGVDDEKIYKEALVESGACVEYFTGTPIELLNETNKKTIRHAEMIDKFENDIYSWRIYPGSSNFTKKEMGILIDYVLDMAANLEIDIFYWRDQFYG